MSGIMMVLSGAPAGGGGGGGGGEPISATLSDTLLTWVDGPGGPILYLAGPVTCTAVGGSGSYTYLWYTSGDEGVSGFSDQTAATTSFYYYNDNPATVFNCTVTDAVTGATGVSDNLSVVP